METFEKTDTAKGCLKKGNYFKDYQAFENKKGICYIPELSDEKYTYKDFMQIAKGNKNLAHTLFCIVDWQHPETLLDEIEIEGDLDDYERCGLI